MIVGAPNATLYRDFANYPNARQVRRAFEILVGVAATSTRFDGHIRWKGNLREFSFRKNDAAHYGVSVNRKWLKFWFCAPAVNSGRHSRDSLAGDFSSFEDREKEYNEWALKLFTPADVERLFKHVDLS